MTNDDDQPAALTVNEIDVQSNASLITGGTTTCCALES